MIPPIFYAWREKDKVTYSQSKEHKQRQIISNYKPRYEGIDSTHRPVPDTYILLIHYLVDSHAILITYSVNNAISKGFGATLRRRWIVGPKWEQTIITILDPLYQWIER